MDFDGDKFIEWEDFTSYLIETASDQHFTLTTIKDVCSVPKLLNIFHSMVGKKL
jgi:hypothetical protein